jgi:hypothetical protein
MDRFTEDYVEMALWSSQHCDEEGNNCISFDDVDADIAESTLKEMEEDCTDFQEDNAEDLAEFERITGYSGGGDFWLTRCGHGAGFWYRGTGKVGDRLTKAAKVYGSRDLYLGDEGLIYQGG